MPAAIAVLRSIPYLWTYLAQLPAGKAAVHVGYIPRDFLSYVAFIRQAAESGSPFFFDPFTTGTRWIDYDLSAMIV